MKDGEREPGAEAPQAAAEAAVPLAIDAPRRLYAMVLMVISSVAISFGGLIVRNIEFANPWQINFYRSLALIVAVLLILVVQYRGRTLAQVRSIGRAGLVGGVFLATAGITFLQALTHTTVANALFTISAIPFITALLAWIFLKERLQRETLITMLVAALGIGVMMGDGLRIGSGYGNLMAFVTACCFTAFAVIVRHNRQINMLPTILVASLIVAVVAFIASFKDLGITLHDLWLCLLWGGVLSGLANWLFIVASRHLVAAELTLFMLLEFVLGPLWVWIFIAEVPTHWTLAGGLLVLASVTVRALIELRRSGKPLTRGRPSPPG